MAAGCDARCTLQSMVNVLDSLVGNLTAALTAKGMMKNLVFVYSADNGGGPMDGSNYPYKGGKTNFFEKTTTEYSMTKHREEFHLDEDF